MHVLWRIPKIACSDFAIWMLLKMHRQVGQGRLEQTTSLSNALHYNHYCLKDLVCNERYEYTCLSYSPPGGKKLLIFFSCLQLSF